MNSDGGDESTAPLGTGELGAEANFTSSEMPSAAKRHAGGALLLTGVVAVAIVGLFSMRTLTRASAAIEAPTDVERSIESFLDMIQGNESEDGGGVNDGALDVLNASYTQRQVALSDVQRNPFIIVESTTDTGASQITESVDPIERKRRELTTNIDNASQRLTLRTVLMGSQPLANINNEVLRVGETITVPPENITFAVEKITSDSVVLVAGDPDLDVRVAVTVSIRRDR